MENVPFFRVSTPHAPAAARRAASRPRDEIRDRLRVCNCCRAWPGRQCAAQAGGSGPAGAGTSRPAASPSPAGEAAGREVPPPTTHHQQGRRRRHDARAKILNAGMRATLGDVNMIAHQHDRPPGPVRAANTRLPSQGAAADERRGGGRGEGGLLPMIRSCIVGTTLARTTFL
eukprot:SAG22_NODE_408_length_10942_cov_6.157429_9_plen_173_part_00